ncbi:hypothetical protein C1Y11_14915 [Pseudomonas sp. FW305-20]|nr:hypothetical protein PFAS1_18200 [Pseudomonas frederiksbergensis]PMU09697.1 hypothetical protein C1Y11_14915 [Pseudomonas sp. FW305-20]PMU18091.1 hypothetical protein C1Y10_13665 [Pseudomonas sp. FW305-122]PMU39396.1 hypothetical protein C1Y12_13420 [Pseudomonas sp. FW305-47B]PMX56978.1 hypothetical protein C1Y13_26070 [Pseudomonas sp. FW305-33]PMX66366.1 hypothetical protein C1X12_16805 [Pseudomonas sp. FW305-60]
MTSVRQSRQDSPVFTRFGKAISPQAVLAALLRRGVWPVFELLDQPVSGLALGAMLAPGRKTS